MKVLMFVFICLQSMASALAFDASETENFLTRLGRGDSLSQAQARETWSHIYFRENDCNNGVRNQKVRNCYLTAKLYIRIAIAQRNPNAGRLAFDYVKKALEINSNHNSSIALLVSIGLRFENLRVVQRAVVERELGITGIEISNLALGYCSNVNDRASGCADLRNAISNG